MVTFKFANGFSKAVSFIIGAMFLVVGLLFFLKFDPDAYDRQTTGTIVEIEEYYDNTGEDSQLMHNVYIDYTVDGQTFEHAPYFAYNSKMKVGDTVEFFYMSTDPSQIAGSDKEATPYIGLALAVAGLGMIVVTVVKIIRKKPM